MSLRWIMVVSLGLSDKLLFSLDASTTFAADTTTEKWKALHWRCAADLLWSFKAGSKDNSDIDLLVSI